MAVTQGINRRGDLLLDYLLTPNTGAKPFRPERKNESIVHTYHSCAPYDDAQSTMKLPYIRSKDLQVMYIKYMSNLTLAIINLAANVPRKISYYEG